MKRRYHLHFPGLVFAALTLIVGVAALNGQNNLLIWVFGVMVCSVLISGMVSGVMLTGLRVRRLDPYHGTVGEPMLVRYAVRNRNRLFAIFNIHIEELPVEGESSGWQHLMPEAQSWVMHVGAKEEVHGEAIFWPHRRGEAKFDRIRIWTTFPFGIIKKSVTISQPQHTLIYPMLYQLRRDVLRAITAEGAIGTHPAAKAGDGVDYYGVRDYRPGDSLRHIAWKRLAQSDQLVSIERTRQSPPRLRLILNLCTPTEALPTARNSRAGSTSEDSWRNARELEERAVSLAASIIHAADLAGYEVGLSVPGTGSPPSPVRRNQWHHAKLMAALAEINLDAQRADDAALWTPEVERVAIVVVHVDGVETGRVRESAVHFTAQQLDHLAVDSIGWDPQAPENRDRIPSLKRNDREEVAA